VTKVVYFMTNNKYLCYWYQNAGGYDLELYMLVFSACCRYFRTKLLHLSLQNTYLLRI
jgi:hypothetical protein